MNNHDTANTHKLIAELERQRNEARKRLVEFNRRTLELQQELRATQTLRDRLNCIHAATRCTPDQPCATCSLKQELAAARAHVKAHPDPPFDDYEAMTLDADSLRDEITWLRDILADARDALAATGQNWHALRKDIDLALEQ